MEELEMIRGDSLTLCFPIVDDKGNNIIETDIDTLILTARQLASKESKVLFVKTKENFMLEDNLYCITISPTDTEEMFIKNFFFDIEVTLLDGTRKSKVGQIKLTQDYTIHGGDESAI